MKQTSYELSSPVHVVPNHLFVGIWILNSEFLFFRNYFGMMITCIVQVKNEKPCLEDVTPIVASPMNQTRLHMITRDGQ